MQGSQPGDKYDPNIAERGDNVGVKCFSIFFPLPAKIYPSFYFMNAIIQYWSLVKRKKNKQAEEGSGAWGVAVASDLNWDDEQRG